MSWGSHCWIWKHQAITAVLQIDVSHGQVPSPLHDDELFGIPQCKAFLHLSIALLGPGFIG